ncbi:fimbrial protein [Rahnella laticis]|uniref:Type 1 fimbrial protein n=1 Tax=Rahnella laticis TaxID=2787622 RepID=A0ABS0E172_9GAMM|nr:fimbrial protein [Rahnella laticis]MBF7978833.1 type 1 fimbrial protein [Rahnella laticis]MBF7998923.1 type 1 fimbrial protein [Rahnella sp. LAC-M12]
MRRLLKQTVLILMAGAMSHAAQALDLNISGTVIASPCTVDTSSVSKDVDFGTVRSTDLKDAGSASDWKSFSVNLINCPVSTTKAQVTFTGNPAQEDATMYDNAGTASNVAVQMATYADKSNILGNGTSMTVNIDAQHQATYLLAGRLVSINGNTGPGTFNSVVQLNFTYQ